MRPTFTSIMLACALLMGLTISGIARAADGVNEARFTNDGQVSIPEGWRQWVFIGSPLTPNALNDGKAPFPEFHNVYIEPSAFDHWKKTGKFANGTQIAKELVFIRKKDKDDMNADGSTAEVSGVGYFQGEFSGLELTVKDTKRIQKSRVDGPISVLDTRYPMPKRQKLFLLNLVTLATKPLLPTILYLPNFIPFFQRQNPKKDRENEFFNKISYRGGCHNRGVRSSRFWRNIASGKSDRRFQRCCR